MLEKIYETSKYVSEHSKYVKINYEVIDQFIDSFNETVFWLNSNPFNILDLNYKDIINFLIIYHTIGDYCFWGNPKWEIQTDLGKLDGSFAIMYLILERYKKNKNFEMSFDEFKELLKGNIEIPLLKQRYEQLTMMNKYLGENSFYEQIENIYDDNTLLNYIIENLTYFEDERNYGNKKIYFYKRAQLLTSDILHVRKSIEKVSVDYSNLIGCADYKIPQVMNCLGMLIYSPSLEEKILKIEEIEMNSEFEVEIRANTLIVIDYIYNKLNKKIPRVDINDYIWLLGQNKSKINKPYHRTKTVNY